MASVGFGSSVAAVAPASLAGRGGRRRRFALVVPAATRGGGGGGGQAAAKEEKGLADFIFGAICKKDQLLETDPLLDKVDGAPSSGSTVSRKATGTTAGGKKAAGGGDGDGDGGGFNFGGLFAKKG